MTTTATTTRRLISLTEAAEILACLDQDRPPLRRRRRPRRRPAWAADHPDQGRVARPADRRAPGQRLARPVGLVIARRDGAVHSSVG